MVTLDKGSPWHPLVVSIRGWPFLGRFDKGMDVVSLASPGRFDKQMDALAPMDFHLEGH